MSVLESYELLRFAEQLRARISAVQEEQAARQLLGGREHRWLAEALDVLDAPLADLPAALESARALPELEDLALEVALERQNKWVDALEKLLAGITFHAGSRSPLIESLFPHQKLATLRRASREITALFATDFERRLKSGYVTRMLGSEDFAFIHPTVERVKQAFAEWQEGKAGMAASEETLARAREGLVALARRAERAIRQAKLLAEAALSPVDNAFEDAGLNAKPRKRAGRGPEKAAAEQAGAAGQEPAPAPAPEAPAEAVQPEAAVPAEEQKAAAPPAAAAPAETSSDSSAPAAAQAPGGKPPKAPRKKKAPKQSPAAAEGASSDPAPSPATATDVAPAEGA